MKKSTQKSRGLGKKSAKKPGSVKFARPNKMMTIEFNKDHIKTMIKVTSEFAVKHCLKRDFEWGIDHLFDVLKSGL